MINTIKIRCLNCKQLSTFDISKKHANLEILFIDRLPCCSLLYDYEPPKPENKVIVIKADPSFYFVDALDPGIGYVCENDAIRAAMTWIGEKARHLIIKRPDWCPVEREEYLFVAGWTYGQRESLREALLMRWPIEVLEEA